MPSQFHQVQTSSYITAVDISSSAQTIAIGDGNSMVFQYADREDFDVNPYSLPLMPPDPQPHTASMAKDVSLSSVGMPYYTEQLLSVWPNTNVYEVGHRSTPLDEEVLKNMKTIDFVGYAPNPGNVHRNQVPRKKKMTAKRSVPKFRSEQERELLQSNNGLLDIDEVRHSGRRSSSVGDLRASDPAVVMMPKYYQRVEIQYSKFGVDDFDFGYYNSTLFGGLETHIRNSYCNSFLQMLYFITPLRMVAKSHIKTSCPKDNCLLCELGFLFRMLEDSKGQNCQATNFLRAFSTIPQANALGLFEPETPLRGLSYSTLIQNFTRFVMEQIHQEANISAGNPLIFKPLIRKIVQVPSGETERLDIPSTVQQLFGLQTVSQSRCGNCLNQYQPTATKKVICGLPGVLLINSGAANSEEAAIWRQNGPSNTKSPTMGQDGVEIEQSTSNEEPLLSAWLPERLGIRINNCELIIKALPVGKEIPPEFKESPERCAIYELSATILQVQADEDLPHLVSQIKVPESDLEPDAKTPWYLFNDFLVHKIRPEEVLSFKGTWKTPAVIEYKRINLDKLLDLSVLPSEIDHSLLFRDFSVASEPNPDPRHEVLSPEEMPKKGTLVAIDAEFVALQQEETEIRSDGTKSLIRPSTLTLARVSVLRGDEGPKEALPFIDDYISTTEPVVDYLTEFSGIVAGDLDIARSKRTLVPLKVAYKKLRLLVDLGCIFIGHGLNKDFRIINLLVPPEQIIDTVDIYHIRNRQRKISLRFLAWHLLNQDIQLETHDSIEDSRTALVLYRKYIEYRNSGKFGQVLEEIYDAGHKANWLKGPKEVTSKSSSSDTPDEILSTLTSSLLPNGFWPL
ncbi:ubiquitin carboxyl-terminal hydrolase-domain-containing protein [Sporodiniella umbellata]|nr:ubiquitin carboxyl-terminal hydrolase-domain-containing protein [Sporodiniella umbellata]